MGDGTRVVGDAVVEGGGGAIVVGGEVAGGSVVVVVVVVVVVAGTEDCGTVVRGTVDTGVAGSAIVDAAAISSESGASVVAIGGKVVATVGAGADASTRARSYWGAASSEFPAMSPPAVSTTLAAVPATGSSVARPMIGSCASHDSGPIANRSLPSETFRNARTIFSSNCVPAHAASSLRASSGLVASL